MKHLLWEMSDKEIRYLILQIGDFYYKSEHGAENQNLKEKN